MTSETSDQLKTGNTIPLCEGNQVILITIYTPVMWSRGGQGIASPSPEK